MFNKWKGVTCTDKIGAMLEFFKNIMTESTLNYIS